MQPLTQEIIDTVFQNEAYRKRYKNNRERKTVCEMSLSGMPFGQIAKRVGRSVYFCRQCVYMAGVFYTVHLEE